LQVHVSDIGAHHLADPSRLEASARRIYGGQFDTLWGELAPVPKENIRIVGPNVLGLECFPSPGHASHHVCYLAGDGTLYAGDAAGVRLQPERSVLPPTPPPEFELEAWYRTLDEIERRRPARLALVHFGVATDPGPHLAELRQRLGDWTRRVGDGVTEAEFSESIRVDMAASGADAEIYERAMPFWQAYAGLTRYWEQRRAS
jgi:glyoxylase-like metal-dependent hydrolase (beta-lactamase superfamily II)